MSAEVEKSGPGEDAENVSLTVSVPADVYARLSELAKARDLTVDEAFAALVREADDEAEQARYKEGSLEQKSGILKKWNKRWFELQDISLVGYNSASKGRQRIRIDLDKCKVHAGKTTKKSAEFSITTRSGKVLGLRAASAEDREGWMDLIEQAAGAVSKLLENIKEDDECIDCIRAAAEGAADDLQEVEGEEDENLFSLPVKDVEGKEHLFRDIIKQEFAVIALLRHFG